MHMYMFVCVCTCTCDGWLLKPGMEWNENETLNGQFHSVFTGFFTQKPPYCISSLDPKL